MRVAAITTAILGSLLGTAGGTAKAKAIVSKESGTLVTTQHRWSNMVYSCESRGQRDPWYTNTGNGFFFGPQFTPGTWHAFGGGPVSEMGDRGGRPMHSYSVAYIINVAERVLRGQGYMAWPNCHGYL